MQPLRHTPNCAVLKAALQAAKTEIEDLRSKLAAVVPKLREMTEALTREKELTAQLRAEATEHGRGHGV